MFCEHYNDKVVKHEEIKSLFFIMIIFFSYKVGQFLVFDSSGK